MGLLGGIGDFVGDVIGGITGSTQADAISDAGSLQAAQLQAALDELIRGKTEGLGFLEPFGGVGQEALSRLGILFDPKEQMSFLQGNPLFQMALDNANQQTMQTAAAGGRLSAGDTLQQLSENVLLSASPLLSNQQSNIWNLLGFGGDLARSQANTSLGVGSQLAGVQQDIGNTLAASEIGQANAGSQGMSNLLNLGLTDFSNFGNTGFGKLGGLLSGLI